MSNVAKNLEASMRTGGIDANAPKDVFVADRVPTSSDKKPIGTFWTNKSTGTSYQLTAYVTGVPTWQVLGASSGYVETDDIVDSAVTTAKINDDAVTAAKIDDGAVATVALDPTTIQYATVSLTNTNIKNLAATQIELVPAQGAGTVVEFVSAQLKLVYGSDVLTESGDNLAVKYTDASGVAVSETIESTGFIDQSANTYTNAIAIKDTIVAATGAENKALVLDNLGSEFAGNASNDTTMEIGIAYRVHTL